MEFRLLSLPSGWRSSKDPARVQICTVGQKQAGLTMQTFERTDLGSYCALLAVLLYIVMHISNLDLHLLRPVNMRLFLFVPECVVFTWGVTGLSHLAVCHAPIRGDSSGLAGIVLFLLLTPLISTVEARAHRDPGWSSGACPFGLWLDECPCDLSFYFFFPSDFIFWCLKFGQWHQSCKTALPLSLSLTARKWSALRSGVYVSLTRHHLWQPGNVFAPKRHKFFSPLWN